MRIPHLGDAERKRDGGGRVRFYAALAALLWLAFSVVDLALIVASEESRRALAPFSPLLRGSLIATELAAAGLFAALLAAPLSGVEAAFRKVDSSAARSALKGAAYLVGFIASAAFATSWFTFLGTGEFLNLAAIRLGSANPKLLFQHAAEMSPASLVVLPVAAVGGAGLIGLWLPGLVRRFEDGRRRLLIRRGVLVWLIAVLASAAGSTSFSENPNDPAAVRYLTARDRHTGPAAQAIAEVRGLAFGTAGSLPVSDNVAVEHQPIISIDAYLASVSDSVLEARESMPNVMIVLVESLRADQLRAYGSERSVMPHVDSLAEESLVFLDAYAQSSHSNYADLPPLTSQYPLQSERMHIYREDSPYPRVLIYDILASLGYRTGIFSSQNEYWGGMVHVLDTGSLDRLLHSETYDGPTYIPSRDEGFAEFARGQRRAGKIDDRFTIAEAIEWIGANDSAPFFTYINLQNSHVPYETPDDFPRRFGPEEISFGLRFGTFPPEKVDVVKDLYANSLAYVDHQLGRLLAALEQSGRLKNTIIVLSGDTGQAFYEHGFAAHAGPLYEEVVRVPLLIRPVDRQYKMLRIPAQHVDVPPTILELIGLPNHPAFQGTSLLESKERDAARYLVAQSPLAHQYAVVHDGWKLIFDARADQMLLYDLEQDPGEMRDIARENPSRVVELSRMLGSWRDAQLTYYQTPHLYSRYYPPDYKFLAD